MIFTETALEGPFIVEPERLEDERGFFARIWDRREFAQRGLAPAPVQSSISFSRHRGTLRGMHYQTPHPEAKLVRCTRGAIYDVIIDLRSGSPTFTRHLAVVLDAENRKMLYVPEGFAHGFLTLADDTEVAYQMSEVYMPEHARAVRWNDPAFGVHWPEEVRVISPRDASIPDFRPPVPLRP
jgi:dTDP-4-dehydrorhamnose 3,5-epimerase